MAIVLDFLQSPKLAVTSVSAGGALDPSTTYYYCIISLDAFNLGGYTIESCRSNIVQATTDAVNKTINLAWNIPPGATYFNILRSTVKADLEGDESVSVLLTQRWDYTTTRPLGSGATAFADANQYDPGTAYQYRYWFRKHGCPIIDIQSLTFTSGAPGSIEDVYAADLAGTLELMPDEAAVTDSPHSLRTPVAPADSLQLVLDIVVSNYVGAGTVTVNGRNVMGDVVTEAVSITGNGTFTTTKTYAAIDVAGLASTGTYDFKVEQGRWGYVHPMPQIEASNDTVAGNTLQWLFNASFRNQSHYLEEMRQILYRGGFQPTYVDSADCSYNVGERTSYSGVLKGCDIAWSTKYRFNNPTFYRVNFSGSRFSQVTSRIASSYATLFASSWVIRIGPAWSGGSDLKWYKSIYHPEPIPHNISRIFSEVAFGEAISFFGLSMAVPAASTIDFGDSSFVGYIFGLYDSTLKNFLSASSSLNWDLTNPPDGAVSTVINPIWYINDAEVGEPRLKFSRSSAGAGRTSYIDIYYTQRLLVLDEFGNPIQGALVNVYAADGTLAYSELTDVNGWMSDQDTRSVRYTLDGDNTPFNLYGYATGNISGLTPYHPRITAAYECPYTVKVYRSGYVPHELVTGVKAAKLDLLVRLKRTDEI